MLYFAFAPIVSSFSLGISAASVSHFSLSPYGTLKMSGYDEFVFLVDRLRIVIDSMQRKLDDRMPNLPNGGKSLYEHGLHWHKSASLPQSNLPYCFDL